MAMRPKSVGLGVLLAALAIAAVMGQESAGQQEATQDQLVKHLAGLFVLKENGDIDNAQNSLRIFQGVLHEEISQNYLNETRKVKGTGTIPQQLVDWFEEQVKGPSAAFFHETIQQHLSGLIPNATTFNEILNAPKPDLSYFKDPNQDPAGDLLSGFETASVGKIQGPDFIDYSPCLVSSTPSGALLSAAAIDFAPQLISLQPQGVGLFPAGIYIQPSIIYISPYGVYPSPFGLNIAPSLISISPYLDSASPAGFNIAPTGISISTPSRKLLAGEEALHASTGNAAHTASATSSTPGDPADVWLQSYSKWVSLMANIATKYGGKNHDLASRFMADTLARAKVRLQNWKSGNITDLLPGGVTFQDPMFFDNQASNISSNTRGYYISSEFINYAPCIVGNFPAGLSVTAAGLEITPTGILIGPAAFQTQTSGINVVPTLILVNPIGGNYAPSGGSVAPSLISFSPVFHSMSSSAYSVSDAGISVNAKTGEASGPWVAPKPSPSG